MEHSAVDAGLDGQGAARGWPSPSSGVDIAESRFTSALAAHSPVSWAGLLDESFGGQIAVDDVSGDVGDLLAAVAGAAVDRVENLAFDAELDDLTQQLPVV